MSKSSKNTKLPTQMVTVKVAGARTVASRKSKDLFSGKQRAPHGKIKSGRGFNVSDDYINTLNDPFQYGPVHLGWGTYVPTATCTAYLTLLITTNADGSFAVGIQPLTGTNGPTNDESFLIVNNLGNSTPPTVGTVQHFAASNNASIASDFSALRCVSLGVKCTPQIAETAPAGMLAAGLISRGTGSGSSPLITLTVQNLFGLPTSTRISAKEGIAALWRPTDATSFEYNTQLAASAPTTLNPTQAWPYICGLGLPASTPVWVEVVGNYEGISGSLGTTDIPNIQDTVSKTHANPESFLARHADKLSRTFSTVASTLAEYGPHVRTAMNVASAFMSREELSRKQAKADLDRIIADQMDGREMKGVSDTFDNSSQFAHSRERANDTYRNIEAQRELDRSQGIGGQDHPHNHADNPHRTGNGGQM